ncbi:MAG TPA: 2Fe-2S iron-sulfur cluster-binding protein, partial [Candidatus Limnocylindrales bacterium]|nr:2Fe-2S iron-sulfur cluster-binding protein [Candidatus Limnocylindrales bacterium]
ENKTMLLDILTDCGINIPQLCNHPSLASHGTCRLCVVEITRKEWNGHSKIVISCLYPAEDGLLVSTRSKNVLNTRRTLLELYLAQHPGSEIIRELACIEGVDSTPFEVSDGGNRCVLCGLCIRACQDNGPGAIATLGRGVEKQVGPNPDGVSDDCTGCRACAHVCPADAIPLQQQNQTLTIWNRNFSIPICSVQPEYCRGCGLCEEVCPFSIPRVSMFKNKVAVSQISQTACLGCGICAGSCPTGAIKQKKTESLTDYEFLFREHDLKGKTIVFACLRSPMPAEAAQDIIRVSCIGSVDIATLLYCIASGANGVALMCRDRLSCPYGRGGELGEKKIAVAKELLALCGLGRGQAALLQPHPGHDGPFNTWREFSIAALQRPSALKSTYVPAGEGIVGMDLALDLVRWLKSCQELKPVLPTSITSLFEDAAEETTAILFLDRLPELDLLLSLILEEPVLLQVLADAAHLLNKKNIPVRCTFAASELEQGTVNKVIAFSPQGILPVPEGTTFTTIDELAGENRQSAEENFSFRISAQLRTRLIDDYAQAEDQFACSTPELYSQYALLLRRGAWQQTLLKQPPLTFSRKELKNEAAHYQNEAGAYRIENHPILSPQVCPIIKFTFNETSVAAKEGEVISSALYAAGITIFGHHHKDGAAQGIYCVNGQCSQCMVIADGKPVKACMTPVRPGMQVQSADDVPALPKITLDAPLVPGLIETAVDVLIIGGGPAGISAAIELGSVGVDVLLIDDKQDLGGKLSLQTHNFFGSVSDCYAGCRGIHIGRILTDTLNKLSTVKVWLNSTVVGVFNDGNFGVSGNGAYKLVKPKRVLFSTGAREKSLAFPGCDLPGVYGAGAFQTLANRDLIRCAAKLFIIGGGNVGLIGAYHALQAGVDVVGLVEALPQCGGYKVHEDKIKRLGVPIWTGHTVLRVEGDNKVERVIIAAVNNHFQPIAGTERSFEVDTVLVAVGLNPVDELLKKSREYNIEVYTAGDAEEIAEASAAIFSGKIIGRKMAQAMGIDLPVPVTWEAFGQLLKHRPGESLPFQPPARDDRIYPLIRCMQEIPCNPCIEACPQKCITMPESILSLPEFGSGCLGCGQCVLACPGLAITVLFNDYDPQKESALLLVPFEFNNDIIPIGQETSTTDMEGNPVGKGKVVAFKESAAQDSRRLLLLEVPFEDRLKVAGFRIRNIDEGNPLPLSLSGSEEPVVCRCERVRKSEIVREIRAGVRDMNQLKALIRTGAGGCNGKTCTDMILKIYKEEGVSLSDITMPTFRPLITEMHLGDFLANDTREGSNNVAP